MIVRLNQTLTGPLDEVEMDIQQPTVLDPVEQVEDVVVSQDHPQKILKIGTRLDPHHWAKLITFLRDHPSIFTWSVHDLIGIEP